MERAVDAERLKATSMLVFSKLEGAVTAAMVHLGDRLGLYGALAAADGPLTPADLAVRTGLSERWVAEWLANQAAAGLLDHDGEGARYSITPEVAAVLADADSPAFGAGSFRQLPSLIGVVDRLPETFRTGIGYGYDTFGVDGAAGIEASFAPWYRHFLVPVALPLLDGVVERLEAGAQAADIGCGAGRAVLTMAAAFPASTFHGYDISQHALDRAEAARTEAGAANAVFHDPRRQPLPDDGSMALVTAFDCLHDMSDPAAMAAGVRAALDDDGVWLLVDIKARESFAENLAKNPMAALMYGMSVLSCLPSSTDRPGGAGLGTLGLTEPVARSLAADAGFTRFRRLPLDHPINAFYEIRP